jgi:serine/threonine-protein kinase HipA
MTTTDAERIVFNIAIGNNDDHARNHTGFWDGDQLTLTSAYDLCPQVRSGETSNQAIAIGRPANDGSPGTRASTMKVCVDAAHVYGLDRHEAMDVIGAQIETINDARTDVAEKYELTTSERNSLFHRQILNPSILYDMPRPGNRPIPSARSRGEPSKGTA